MQELKVLVTGGSRGIGKAIVEHLVKDGGRVVFSYRSNEAAAQALIAELSDAPGQVVGLRCDVGNFQESKQFFQEACEFLGGCDALINNAGVTQDKMLFMMSEDAWHEVIQTNLSGTFNVCKVAIATLMKQKRGAIVNVSSVSGLIGVEGQVNYCASKAGVIGLSRALAREAGRRNVRVNVIAPGFIETDMVAELPDKYREKILERVPLGRFGQAHEVANLAAFLISDKANYITGQVFVIDGGMTA
jgi:3-oxoacyl-[acyl-carrier protein] reductase